MKVKIKTLQVGDLVLKANINKKTINEEIKGKLKPNCIGSYVIFESTRSRAYTLSMMDEKEKPKIFNVMHLKCFYVQVN